MHGHNLYGVATRNLSTCIAPFLFFAGCSRAPGLLASARPPTRLSLCARRNPFSSVSIIRAYCTSIRRFARESQRSSIQTTWSRGSMLLMGFGMKEPRILEIRQCTSRAQHCTRNFLTFVNTTAIACYQNIAAPGNFLPVCNSSRVYKRQKITSTDCRPLNHPANHCRSRYWCRSSSFQSEVHALHTSCLDC